MNFSRRLEEVMAREGGSMEERNLEALEQQLEQEVQRWENSAIRIGQLLNQIKESEAYKEAGYRYFQPYYRERWEQRIGRTWQTAKHYMNAASVVAEMSGGQDLVHPITDVTAAEKLEVLKDRAERVRVWNEHVESGEPRAGYQHLEARIREARGLPPREQTVGDILGDDWDKDLPEPGLKPEQKVPTQLGSFHTFVYRLNPEAVVDAVQEMQTSPDLSGEIKTVDSLLAWLESYRDALVSRQATPLRAVKGGEK